MLNARCRNIVSVNAIKNTAVPQVILVHGTWASAAQWTKRGSTLRDALEREFPDSIAHEVTWGGANSPWGRGAAAAAIADAIRSTDAMGRVVIVAHSHGGNGALHALHELDVADQRKVAALVCLATPFIDARARSIPGSDADLASDAASAILWTPLLFYAFWKFLSYDLPILEEDILAEALSWRADMILVFVLLLFLRFPLGAITKRLIRSIRASATEWADLLQTPTSAPCPVLTVRTQTASGGSNDEAVMALRASHGLASMMFGAWNLMASRKRPSCGCFGCTPTAVLLMVVFFLLAAPSPTIGAGPELFVMQLVAGLLQMMASLAAVAAAAGAAFIGVSFGLLLLFGGLSLLFAAYGLRSLSWGRRGEHRFSPLVVDLSANSRAPFDTHELVLPRPHVFRHWFSTRSLVHSVYLDERAVSSVASWLKAQVENELLRG